MQNNISIDNKSFRNVMKLFQNQQDQKIENLKISVTTIPVPDEVLHHLTHQGGWHRHEIMSHHPGHKLENAIQSLSRTLETYRKCYSDFIARFDAFQEAAKDRTLFTRPREQELEEYEIACRKEIFSLSSSATTLIDMTRRIVLQANRDQENAEEKIDIPDFHTARTEMFDANQHEFIRDLRNNLNHAFFHEANWSLRDTGENQTSHLEFDCEKLKHEGDFSAKARSYMDGQKSIDIRPLFENYHAHIVQFYGWLLPEIENRIPPSVQDYRRCLRLWDANLVRMTFNLIFSQVVKPTTDLYSHLPKYFTSSEMREINALPHQSKEQVDKIISLYDEYGACDDSMRDKIYKAFKVIT